MEYDQIVKLAKERGVVRVRHGRSNDHPGAFDCIAQVFSVADYPTVTVLDLDASGYSAPMDRIHEASDNDIAWYWQQRVEYATEKAASYATLPSASDS